MTSGIIGSRLPDVSWRPWLKAALQPSTFLGLALIAFAWVSVAVHLDLEKKAIVEATQHNTSNLARTFDAYIYRAITDTDNILQSLQASYTRNPERFDIESARPYLGDFVLQISIIGPDGALKASTKPLTQDQHIDLRDREQFQALSTSSNDDLFITKPETGKRTSLPSIWLCRRLVAKDGSFAGIISAAIYTSTLSRFYNSINVGNDGSIALWGLDGFLRASRGYKKEISEASHLNSNLFKNVAVRRTGFFFADGSLDDVPRMISYRQVESLPLLVSVGLAQHEVFADYWRQRTWYYTAISLLTAVTLIIVCFNIARQRRLNIATAKMLEMQEALSQIKERAQLIAEAVNEGIWDVNLLTNQYYVSTRWNEILGYANDDLSREHEAFFDLAHPDDRAALNEKRHKHLASTGRQILTLEFRLRCKNGDYRWVQTRGALIRDETGRPVRLIGTMTDITARKLEQAALEEANKALEQRVAERTAQLSQEMRMRETAQLSLLQAQKMEAVGQLAAGTAHDFNNLLAVISGSLEFIDHAARRGLPAEPELIDASLRASRRGRDLVERLLAFSQQRPLHTEPTLLDQLVLDTLRLLQRSLGESIETEVQLDAPGAAVAVDRGQLANALVNLALNARDAMPEGGQLTIATECRPARQADDRGHVAEEVWLTIRDTGHGMTEDVRRRAFEPFFTTKPDHLGSGLGLSMVYGFVEQSGGHIEIESAVECGTTVTIRLPRIAIASLPHPAETDPAAANAKQKTVMLVEDDADVRTVTTAQLKKLGYKVCAVANGHEALDLIVSPARFDVMLTDMVLPAGIDGITVIKETMRVRPKIGVLCMTGYAPTQKDLKWLKVQNIACMNKPFSMAQLSEALDSVMAN
jgi:PAS domain S-box-containing protein